MTLPSLSPDTLLHQTPQFLDRRSVSRESVDAYNLQAVGLNVLHELDQELWHQNFIPLTVFGQISSKHRVCGEGGGKFSFTSNDNLDF